MQRRGPGAAYCSERCHRADGWRRKADTERAPYMKAAHAKARAAPPSPAPPSDAPDERGGDGKGEYRRARVTARLVAWAERAPPALPRFADLHPEVPTRLILGGLHAAGVADVHVIPPVFVPSWLGGADGGAPPLLQRIFVDGSLSLLHGATYETPETIRMR